jgi:ABC-type transport system involved in multi-copper enzyme maturation permease subunit
MRLFAEERGTGTLETLMTAPLRDWQVVVSKYLACFAFYIVLWLPTLAYLPVLCDLHKPEFHASWTAYSITLLAGLAFLLVSVVLALIPAGTQVRVASLVLLLLGALATAIGGWGHYHSDVARGIEPLLTIHAGIDPWPVVASYLGLALVGAMFLALGLFISSLVRSQMVAALVSLVLCFLFICTVFWRPEMDPGSLAARGLDFVSVPLHFSKDFSRGLVDTRHLTLYASVAVFSLVLTVRSLEGRRWR